ncbi:MAG: hypothetical protein DMF90_24600 [Acidobacteria bacterium]|nr:MAG: hypothetical protein DMF90_24600 [Acidobacteriota bacterium]
MRSQTTDKKSGERRFELDDIDIQILQRVQEDARIANVDLAAQVGLSPAPCLRRVRALERAGVIRSYTCKWREGWRSSSRPSLSDPRCSSAIS